jgi:hypothetical protein
MGKENLQKRNPASDNPPQASLMGTENLQN